MPGRRRTAKSLANDVIVRRAIINEIVASGVDRIGPTAVARRAGFTTGAIYGRYENSVEMVIDVWLTELWPRYAALLEGIVAAVVDHPAAGAGPSGGAAVPAAGLDGALGDLLDPPAWVLAATEVLAVAHRSDELAEVIRPEFRRFLDRCHAGVDAPPRRRTTVLLVVGAVIGCGVHELADLRIDAMVPMFDWARRAGAADAGPLGPLELPDVGELEVDTGELERDRLIGACIEVIADVGFERATISRIARRAGIGTHEVYAEHAAKLDLLVDAIDVFIESLLNPAVEHNLAEGSAQATPMGAAALALSAFLDPARRTARLARLEALVAARHYPALAEGLDGMWRELLDRYVGAVDLAVLELAETSRPALYYLAAELSGLPVVDALAGPVSDVDWRLGLLPFEQVAIDTWRASAS